MVKRGRVDGRPLVRWRRTCKLAVRRPVWMVLSLAWLTGCAATGGAARASGTGAVTELSGSAAAAEQAFGLFGAELAKADSAGKVDAAWAANKLDAVLRLNPRHHGALFGRAVLLERAGQVEAAQALYRDLVRDAPQFAPALENMAHRWVQEGALEKAAATYRDIVAREPRNQTSRLALARLYYAQKNFSDAIELCRQVLQRQADAVEAFRVLAASYRALGNIPMAELTLARGLKIAPADVPLHDGLAQVLLEENKLTAGINKLKEVVRLDPQRAQARAQLGDIALAYSDFGNAALQYEAILKNHPDHRNTKINLAVAYKGSGRFEMAERLYRDLLSRNPQDVDATWNLAVLYHRYLLRYDEAITHYRAYQNLVAAGDANAAAVDGLVAQLEKQKADVEAARLQAEKQQKQREATEAACQAIAAGQPVAAEAIGNEQERVQVAWQLMWDGQTALQAGELAKGEALVRCALGVVPNTPRAATEACAPMGVMWTQLLYQLGRPADAMAAIETALACDPKNPDALLIKQQLAEILRQAAPAPASSQAEPGGEKSGAVKKRGPAGKAKKPARRR